MKAVKNGTNVHIVIPDTQVKPGIKLDWLSRISQFIWDEYQDCKHLTIIHLGDHWDLPSLSSYDRGKKQMEGRRYMQDIEAGKAGLDLLTQDLPAQARKVFLLGNHEDRISRAAEDNAQLDGLVTLDHVYEPLERWGWEAHPFLEPVWIDGVCYAHYFYAPMSGRPYSSQIELRLKTVGHSFTMGHQQGLLIGTRTTQAGQQWGLVAGSCYEHEEDYKGPQANGHWRGIVICHDVRDGAYDPMLVSLRYLKRRYG